MTKKSTKTTPKKGKERRNWKTPFLAALMQSPNVAGAATAAGVDRSYVYRARADDADFAKAWDNAIAIALDGAEGELYRRSVKGVTRDKGVYYEGEEVAREVFTEYSDTLLIFLLKSHRPERYRETNRNVTLNLTPDQLAAMSDDELDRLYNTVANRA